MISVIIPTFNRPDLLRQCLEALFEQTLHPSLFEVIVIDNYGCAVSKSILQGLSNSSLIEARYFYESKPGLMYARHLGARKAKYDFLLYIDDDIIVNRDWLESFYTDLLHFKPVAMGGSIIICWDKEPPAWVISHEAVLGKIDYGPPSRMLNKGQYINGGSFGISKKTLFEVGGFNPDQIDGHLVGDGETGLCRKLWSNGHHIYWCHHKPVKHMQFVEKNGTPKDIARRFFNNGVCEGFDAVKSSVGNDSLIAVLLLKLIPRFVLAFCSYYFSLTTGFNHDKLIDKKLSLWYRLGVIVPVFKAIFSSSYASTVRRSLWI